MHEANSARAVAISASSAACRAENEETLPEVAPARRETQQFGRGRVVVHLLADVRAKLEPLPQSKQRRALTNKLASLQYVVDAWASLVPAPEQVSAMLEVLLALQESADDALEAQPRTAAR